MSLRVKCPECGHSYDVDAEKRGKKIRCRKCEAPITVPGKAKPADDEEEVVELEEAVEEKPSKKKVAAAPPPAKGKTQRRRDEDYEDEDDEPRDKKGKGKEKKKQGTSPMVFVLVGLLLVVGLGVAGGGIYFAMKGDEPRNVTQNNNNNSGGPGPNVNTLPPPPVGTQPVGNPPPVGTAPVTKVETGRTAPVVDTGKRENTGGGGAVAAVGKVSGNSVYKYVLKSVCMIRTLTDVQTGAGAIGSGQVIDRENRLVLTNYHVVHGLRDFIVLFPVYDDKGKVIAEKEVYRKLASADNVVKGKVLAHSRTQDVALIQLDRVPDSVDAIPFAKEEPGEGDDLHSVGNPGVSGSVWVYTPGKVRKVYNKTYTTGDGHGLSFQINSRIIEATSPTNPGDSGGPCVNDRGELVGITQGGLVGAEAQMSYFIERSSIEGFIKDVFGNASELRGKQWVRSQRAPIPVGGANVANLPSLVDKLSSANATERAEGVQGLAMLGPDARKALPELVKALSDKSDFVRRLAVDALRQVGQPTPEDLPYLLPFLNADNAESKFYVLTILAILGSTPQAAAAGPDVLRLTEDPNIQVRMQAMRALGKLVAAAGAKDARAALEKGIQDPDKRVRVAAAESLTTGVPQVAKDPAKLVELLKHKYIEVRIPAAYALGRLGDKGKVASPELVAALREDDSDLRRAAFVALKEVGADPKLVVPELRRGITDENLEVKRAALEAAGRAGPEAREVVKLIVQETLAIPEVRKTALTTLGQIGPDAARDGAVEVANLLVTDKMTREEAATALGAMKVSGATVALVVPKMIDVFGDEKGKEARAKIADALAKTGKPALPLLERALANPSPDVRRGVATSIAAMGADAKGALRSLQLAVIAEKDVAARDEMQAAVLHLSNAASGPMKP
jgi:predicted Zn finger-like uncharacterized protein